MNKFIYYFKTIKCLLVGHQWSAWEDQKFVSMSSRRCAHCNLHHSSGWDPKLPEETFSLAVGSNWPAVIPLRK